MLAGISSCTAPRKVVYLKDLDPSESYAVLPMPPLRIQKNDRLSISVSAKNIELAAPFNNQAGLYTVDKDGELSSTMVDRGYLVDQQGNIDFPILGTINVEGMSLEGLRDHVKNQLTEKNLLSSAVVKVELQNLKVMVMGEAGNRIITAPDGRLTLLEAITQSGGLSKNATTNRIAVIREEMGQRKIYYNDIESKDIFNSPVYYLQQNDIVYVEPREAVRSDNESRSWRISTMVISVLSLGVTVWAILTR